MNNTYWNVGRIQDEIVFKLEDILLYYKLMTLLRVAGRNDRLTKVTRTKKKTGENLTVEFLFSFQFINLTRYNTDVETCSSKWPVRF